MADSKDQKKIYSEKVQNMINICKEKIEEYATYILEGDDCLKGDKLERKLQSMENKRFTSHDDFKKNFVVNSKSIIDSYSKLLSHLLKC